MTTQNDYHFNLIRSDTDQAIVLLLALVASAFIVIVLFAY